MHLNDYKALELVIPSKIFEYAATGKPILAGVSGQALELSKSIPGLVSFSPCNLKQGVDALDEIGKMKTDFLNEREDFIRKYSRKKLMAKLAALLHSFPSRLSNCHFA